MISSPAITAIVITIFATLSFLGGFTVADWRAGKEMERLKSSNAVLEAANDKCTTDIAAVRQSITDMQNKADERAKAAKISMVVATRTADTHTTKAKQIKSLPPVPADMQCEATRLEQLKYVQERTQ